MNLSSLLARYTHAELDVLDSFREHQRFPTREQRKRWKETKKAYEAGFDEVCERAKAQETEKAA